MFRKRPSNRKNLNRLNARLIIDRTAAFFDISSYDLTEAISSRTPDWNLSYRYEASVALFLCRLHARENDGGLVKTLDLPNVNRLYRAERYILHLSNRQPWVRHEVRRLQKTLASLSRTELDKRLNRERMDEQDRNKLSACTVHEAARRYLAGAETSGDEISHDAALSINTLGLDNALHGLHPGSLTIVSGKQAVGKTSLLVQMAMGLSKNGKDVLFFSIAGDEADVTARFIAQQSLTPLKDLLDAPTAPDIQEGIQELEDCSVHISCPPVTSAFEICQLVMQMEQSSQRPSAILIDNADLLAPSTWNADWSVETMQDVTQRELLNLARSKQIPIIVSLPMETDRFGRDPRASHISYPCSFGRFDTILLLDRSMTTIESQRPSRPDEGIVRIIVAKNTYGPCKQLTCAFAPAIGKFIELESPAYEPAGEGVYHEI